jgi:hypothetical protein
MISTRLHGVIDYLVGLVLLAAPFVLGFADGGVAQWTTIAFGLVAIAYSLFTDYELGLVRTLSFRTHLVLDVIFALLLAASPWLFGFSNLIAWPHVLIGAAGLLVVSLSRRGDRMASHKS